MNVSHCAWYSALFTSEAGESAVDLLPEAKQTGTEIPEAETAPPLLTTF